MKRIIKTVLTVIVLISILVLFKFSFSSNCFYYEKIEDGTYKVYAIDTSRTGKRLIIPSHHNGKPVTVIGRSAIPHQPTGAETIEDIIIPDSVKRIETNAFRECPNLRKVSIGGGVEMIEEGAFSDSYINTLLLDKNNSHFELLNGCLIQNGNLIIGLDDAVVPEGINRICDYAFSGQLIQCIKLPRSCTKIGNYAFSGCSYLEEIELPDGLMTIGTGAFENCTKLQRIALPDSLTEIGKNCLYGTGIREIVIPGTIKTIPDGAFTNCFYLERIRIMPGIERIGYMAFYSCLRLKELDIPSGVYFIDMDAFTATKELTVHYDGDAIPGSWNEYWMDFTGYWLDDPDEDIEVDSVKVLFRDGAETTLCPHSRKTR